MGALSPFPQKIVTEHPLCVWGCARCWDLLELTVWQEGKLTQELHRSLLKLGCDVVMGGNEVMLCWGTSSSLGAGGDFLGA